MRTILFYFLALAAPTLPTGARAATLDDAHAAFAAGKYHESTAGYQSVLDRQGYSAPVLFDLGNSYYREGNFPQAILAYKRALWLAPNDADIMANLQAAQKQAGAAVEQRPAYGKITDLPSANGWAWTGCIASTLLCVSLLLRVLWPEKRGLFSTAGWAGALALACVIGAIHFVLGRDARGGGGGQKSGRADLAVSRGANGFHAGSGRDGAHRERL